MNKNDIDLDNLEARDQQNAFCHSSWKNEQVYWGMLEYVTTANTVCKHCEHWPIDLYFILFNLY